MNLSYLQKTAPVSAVQFGLFRMVLGAYLLVHFVELLPYAQELFGNRGILANPGLNFVPQILPNPLWSSGAPEWLPFGIVAMGAVASLGILTGCWRRTCCLIAWLVWAWLFGRNNLISNPGLPYVGLLLLFGAVIPLGEAFVIGSKTKQQERPWEFPAWPIWGMWFLLAAGYSFSGVMKLGSPSWVDGSALGDVLANPLARPGYALEVFHALPDWVMRLATWGSLGLEIAFLPLLFVRRARPWIWTAMVGMHCGIILLIDFTDLSLGMLVAHLFVFDRQWVAEPAEQEAVLPEAAVQ